MTVPEVHELYAYNRWANDRTLSATAPLDEDRFTRDLGSSFPSVRSTLVHILAAEWVWLSRWLGVSPKEMPRDWFDFDRPHILARWKRHELEQSEFLARLSDDDLERPLSYTNLSGKSLTVPMKHLLRHVVNHSTYHRGQITTMLRQLGVAATATDLVLYHSDLIAAGQLAR